MGAPLDIPCPGRQGPGERAEKYEQAAQPHRPVDFDALTWPSKGLIHRHVGRAALHRGRASDSERSLRARRVASDLRERRDLHGATRLQA